jgi:phage terminase large subunit
MKIEINWDERMFLLELLQEEEADVSSGSTVYEDNTEVLEMILDLMEKLEDD